MEYISCAGSPRNVWGSAAEIYTTMVWCDLLSWWNARQHADELWNARSILSLEGDAGSPEGAIGWIRGVEISMRVAIERHLGVRVIEIRGPHNDHDTGVLVSIACSTSAGAAEQESATGDPSFDDIVAIRAPPLLWIAAADPHIRQLLLRAVRSGARWDGHRWRARFVAPAHPTASQLVDAARAITDVQVRWCSALQREPRAAVLARISDPVPGMRRRAIKVAMEHGWVEEADLTKALADYDPGVRLAAACAICAWDVVIDLVRRGSRTWRVRAAVTLARRAPHLGVREEIEGVLIRALPDPELAELAALALADIGSPAALSALMNAAAPEARLVARVAAARIRTRSAPAGALSLATCDGALSLSNSGGLSVASRSAKPS